MTDKRMSFLPDDYVEQRVEQRTNVLCLTLFVVVLAAVIGAYVVTSRQRSDIRQQQARINEAYAEAARRIEQLDQLRDQKATMLQKAQVTASLLEPVPRTFLLADLINRMPQTMSLYELQVSTQKVRTATPIRRARSALSNRTMVEQAAAEAERNKPVEVLPPTEVALVLVGIAPTDVQVAQYLATLSQSDLLDDVSLIFSEQTKVLDSPVRRFRIEMKLATNADVRRIDAMVKPRRLNVDPMRTPDSIEDLTTVLLPDVLGQDADADAPEADAAAGDTEPDASEALEADAEAAEVGNSFTNIFENLTGRSRNPEK